jgi:DNA-binding NarL/FixJ family response regulator
MRERGIATVGSGSTASEVAALVPATRPVAILVDGGGADAERATALVTVAPDVGVLAVVDEIDLATVVPLLRAGVIGCLAADATSRDLARALVAVGRGEIALPPPIAARALAELVRPMPRESRAIDALSDRELEVVGLVARGLTNKDIAQTLFLSVRTIEAHLRSIYGKLGVRSRTEAVLWAVTQQRETDR